MRKIIVTLMSFVMAASLTACGNQGKTSGNNGQAAGDTDGGIFREAEKDPYNDEIKIGYIPSDAPAAVCVAWEVGIREELGCWSNVTVNTFDGQRDAEKQSTIIQDLISQEYDAIIVQPYTSTTVAVAVENAEAAGIPVITLNIDADCPHAAIVSMTDYETGYTVGKAMAESVGGNGNFVVIQASPGAARGENIEEGFQAALKEYSGITILDEQSGEWNTEKANTVMNDFLTKYDQIDGVFCHNDQMAEGAATAVQLAGRLDEMQIWGANGESKALEYIEQGLMTGTVYTNCYNQGETAARLAMMFIGGNLDTSQFTQTLTIKMPPVIVTEENVGTITESMRW